MFSFESEEDGLQYYRIYLCSSAYVVSLLYEALDINELLTHERFASQEKTNKKKSGKNRVTYKKRHHWRYQ